MQPKKFRIAIFASGEGTNADAIIRYFNENESSVVFSIWTNNSVSGVIKRAEILNVPIYLFSNEELNQPEFLKKLNNWSPDLIVLAGFLRKIPDKIIHQFPGKIINIHPALLPKYGGKGMYGMNIHHAVKRNGEKETGITIHLVDEEYDHGTILYQQKTIITPEMTAEEISNNVRNLELFYYPRIIESYLQSITTAS
ncbi:MAG: phosphoribosylglycinamide formyltransferase [Flavobacteriales bacterium]|nr:phosphoribosylglycinamide formyltransferase [Flavobacteriales bacterium]